MKNFYARCTPWGTIEIGDNFLKLSWDERRAVLAHEKGHVFHHHVRKRIVWLITLRALFDLKGFFEMCEAQELEADKYAVKNGHTRGLVSFLVNRCNDKKQLGYPTRDQRIKAIYG